MVIRDKNGHIAPEFKQDDFDILVARLKKQVNQIRYAEALVTCQHIVVCLEELQLSHVQNSSGGTL